MSNIKVDIDNIDKAFNEILSGYNQSVNEIVEEATIKTGKKVVKELRAKSPVNTGKYSKGWTSKVIPGILGKKALVVYNKNKPGLTHILEKGYSKPTGGRVKARPHIKPVEEKGQDYYHGLIVKGLNEWKE